MMPRRTVAPTLLLLLASACRDDDALTTDLPDAEVADTGSSRDARVGKTSIVSGSTAAPGQARDVDILFMVDNSGSMREEQENLKRQFGTLPERWRRRAGVLPNLHLGVVSSDVGAGSTFISGNPACNRPGGDRGELQVREGCGLNPAARFLIALDDDKERNFVGDLANVFGCIAALGTQGCGYEHQLLSVVAALDPSTAKNAGFLRAGADLAIVLLTDEDDCSGPTSSQLYASSGFEGQLASLRCAIVGHQCNGTNPSGKDEFTVPMSQCRADPAPDGLIPISGFVDAIKALKPNDRNKIAVAAITGWAGPDASYGFERGRDLLDMRPVCSSADGVAGPALRIKAFVDGFGDDGLVTPICSGDFTPAFDHIIDRLSRARETPGCLPGKVADVDPTSPGVQPACQVTADGSNVPPCTADDATGCFRVLAPGAASNGCPSGHSQLIVAGGASARYQCTVCDEPDDPRCAG